MNSFYAKGQERLGTAQIDLVNDNIVAILVHTNDAQFPYLPNFETNEFISDIPAVGRIAMASLVQKQMVGPQFTASDIRFPTVIGPHCEGVAIAKYTGAIETSPLICWIDQGDFPAIPNGEDIEIRWSGAENELFTI